MSILWGAVLVISSLLCWGGQTLAWLAPRTAVSWGLMEAEDDVEPVYWADIRGEAVWDSLTLWTLAAAGVLLIFDNPNWAYLGLIGGGAYVYFGGRGIFTRITMQRRGFRVGAALNVRLGYTFLAVWALIGLVTIAAAVAALPTS